MLIDAGTRSDDSLAQAFVQFSVDSGVLRFGEFKTKAGRLSPYFFNAGLFDDGAKLGRLAQFYAKALLAEGIEFDMIFGPAYKGIPLGAAVAIELARLGRNVPFAYNRKETKDHGEGGSLEGAPLKGRVPGKPLHSYARPAPRHTQSPLRWIARKRRPRMGRMSSTVRFSMYAVNSVCRFARLRA